MSATNSQVARQKKKKKKTYPQTQTLHTHRPNDSGRHSTEARKWPFGLSHREAVCRWPWRSLSVPELPGFPCV